MSGLTCLFLLKTAFPARTIRCLVWQAAQPGAKEGAEAAQAPASDDSAGGKANKAPPRGADAGAAPSASNLFGAFGKRFYDGGFDDKMTRKEAALILGVRESAPAQRIKVRAAVVCIFVFSYVPRGKLWRAFSGG